MKFRSLALLALCLTPGAILGQDQQFKNGQELVGTWSMIVTVGPGAPLCPQGGCQGPALSTITSDGTLVQTATIPGTGTGHGVWKRTGLRKFSAYALYFVTDPSTGVFRGTAESTIEATVDQTGRIVTGDFVATLRLIGQNTPITYGGSVSGARVMMPQ